MPSGSSSMQRRNSKHLASCKDDDDAGDGKRGGDAASWIRAKGHGSRRSAPSSSNTMLDLTYPSLS
jgi:hypothetical protein